MFMHMTMIIVNTNVNINVSHKIKKNISGKYQWMLLLWAFKMLTNTNQESVACHMKSVIST